MKKGLIILIVIILLAGGGYVERHNIKALLSGSSTSQTPTTTSTTMASPTSSMVMNPSMAMIPSSNIYLTKTSSTKGQYITDFQGMTLYVFDKDKPGVSNCANSCATTWPPYTSGATAEKMFPTNIGVMKRADGSSQFTWKNMPLYYYSGDQKQGDLKGDGIGDIWHIVKP